jgi:hypothetical protein
MKKIRITITVDPKVKKQFKSVCDYQAKKMSCVIEKMIISYLQQAKAGRK